MYRDDQAPPAPAVDGAGAGAGEALLSPPDAPDSPARFFLLPLLKSVSYQPPPFSRKPAALILRDLFPSPCCDCYVEGDDETFVSRRGGYPFFAIGIKSVTIFRYFYTW